MSLLGYIIMLESGYLVLDRCSNFQILLTLSLLITRYHCGTVTKGVLVFLFFNTRDRHIIEQNILHLVVCVCV